MVFLEVYRFSRFSALVFLCFLAQNMFFFHHLGFSIPELCAAGSFAGPRLFTVTSVASERQGFSRVVFYVFFWNFRCFLWVFSCIFYGFLRFQEGIPMVFLWFS